MAITGRRLTAQEFLELPEEKPYLELIDGEVVQKPLPQEQHGFLALELGGGSTATLDHDDSAWPSPSCAGRSGRTSCSRTCRSTAGRGC